MYQKQIDTTVKLWDHLYKVRIPYLASRSIEDIREKGTVISGIESYDADIPNQMQTTYLNIDKMVEYYREGVAVRVCNVADTKEIYEAISAHIYAWKYNLEKGVNIGNAPIDDLILLDRFANTVYEHAKYHFTDDTMDSPFLQQLTSVQRITVSNFFTKGAFADQTADNPDGVVMINADADKIEDRDSLSDFFKSRSKFIRRF